MIFLATIGIALWFILPIVLYGHIIERLNYKYKNIELKPSYAWGIVVFQFALGLQLLYWNM